MGTDSHKKRLPAGAVALGESRLLRVLGGHKPPIFGLAPLSGGDLFFFLGATYSANYSAKENCFCTIGGPVFSGLFSFR